MSQSFLEPYYDPNDSGKTPAQQAGDSLAGSGGVMSAKDTALLRGIKMAGGAVKRSRRISRKKQLGGGRTLNIPYPVPGRPDLIPGPTANNAWYVGEPCVGAHCGVNVVPSASWMINKGLTIGNDVTPGSTTMYPVVDRLGNSFAEILPGVQDYTGTPLNPGPFQIKCVSGGGRKSRKNQIKKKNSRHTGGLPWFGKSKKTQKCLHPLSKNGIDCRNGEAFRICTLCGETLYRSVQDDNMCDDD